MATIRPTLKTDHKKEDGTHSVRIRITHTGQVRYYTTAYSLKKADWNPKATEEKTNWVRGSHRDHHHLNEELEKLTRKFRKISTDHPHYTAAQIRDAYGREEKGAGFLAFAREWIKRKDEAGQHGTARTYETHLTFYTDYFGEQNEVDYLTPSVISRFVGHLRKVPYKASTINIAFTFYRTIIRHGILEGWITPRANPFAVQPVPGEEQPVQRPTVEQLLSLMHLKGLTQVQTHARNVFLMQYFLNGARVSEVYTLRWEQVGVESVTYLPKKRATRAKVVPRHEGIEWVLDQYERKGKYVFPYLSEAEDKLQGAERTELFKRINGQVWSALRQVSFKAGIGYLTSHMQRHTFADHVWEQTGDLRILQDMLGHQSARTSELYLTRLGQTRQQELNRQLYAFGESPGKDAGQKDEKQEHANTGTTAKKRDSERKRPARKRNL